MKKVSKTKKRERSLKILLKILRIGCEDDFDYEVGLCSVSNWLRDREIITTKERNKLLKFIKDNKPKNYEYHLPWYFGGPKARRNWLNRHIEKIENANTK